MKRRKFIQTTAATAAAAPFLLGGQKVHASTSLQMLAQMPPENDRVLVIIQLFGGNDGLNTVIPAQDDEYYNLRPTIAVPIEEAWNNVGDIYLHPSLADGSLGGIATMLENGTLAIVQRVGYQNPNLSHFRSTDIWLSGINNSDPNVRLDTGWIGRYLESRYPDFPASLPEHPLAIQFGGFSLMLRGSQGKKMGIEVTNPDIQQGVSSQLDELDPDSPGTAYLSEYDFIADIAGRSNTYAELVKNAYNSGLPQLQGGYNGNDSFHNQLKSVAALIAGGLQSKVYVVSMGGFDTHVTQQRTDLSGMHPFLLSRLADAVSQFQFDMTRLGQADRVAGMTISEFGRRPRENGSFGTDHGAASVQFVFGTQVNSAIFGNLPNLKDGLNANGDIPPEIDYRQVYAEILTDWFGLTRLEMREVLQDADETLVPLDVLKSQPTSAPNGPGAGNRSVSFLGNHPNPFSSSTTLEFQIDRPSYVTLEISTMTGKRVATLVSRTLDAGTHRVNFSGDTPSGTYIAILRAGGFSDSRIILRAR